jgi:hypothetical protein
MTFGRSAVVGLIVALLAESACREAPKARRHRFEDYPVTEVFKDRTVAPRIIKPQEQSAETIIQEGVARGKWVLGADRKTQRPGPNFAGHYIVIEWGGGPDYWQAIIVDSITGRVFQPPFAGQGGPSASYFSIPMDVFNFRGIDFRLNSKLMVLPRACPTRSLGCSEYYFLWQDDRWIPLS